MQQLQNALTKFSDSEFLKMYNGLEKIMVGGVLSLSIVKLPDIFNKYKDVMQMLGVVNEDLTINIENVYNAFVKYVSDEGERMSIPLLGNIKIAKSDVEMLFNYIRNEATE